MRRIIVIENVTLDGVMQAPASPDEDTRGGFAHGGWAARYNDEVLAAEMGTGMSSGGPLLFGRRTYEAMAGFWPRQTDGNPYTEVLNRVRKYVVSTTLHDPLPWQNSSVISGDVASRIAALKAVDGPDIGVLGSGALVRWMLRELLVDEIVLVVCPLVLGTGQRLFEHGVPTTEFELVGSVPTTTGAIVATYRTTVEA
jgi:dihydrofolate reductase